MNKRSIGSLFDRNPLLGEAIGIAPLVLFSSTGASGLLFGICSLAVLFLTAVAVSLLRKQISRGAALFVFAVISAGICVLAEAAARFVMGVIDSTVLWMLPFLVCNSLYVYRASAVYVRSSVKKSVIDALKIGGSFAGVLVAVSLIREFLSFGSVFGHSLLPAEKACTFFALPAGGLLLFGIGCGIYRFVRLQTGTEAQEK